MREAGRSGVFSWLVEGRALLRPFRGVRRRPRRSVALRLGFFDSLSIERYVFWHFSQSAWGGRKRAERNFLSLSAVGLTRT